MKIIYRTMLIAGTLASLVIAGCSKSDDTTPDPPASATPTSPSISISDGYGTLVAVRSVSYTTVAGITIPVETNTAVAAFSATMGSSTFTDAGTVSLNSKGLTKSSNNSYVYQNLTDPLSFSTLTWNVSGSSSVPAISYTDNRPVPNYSGFSSLPASVSKSAGLTISLGSAVTNADSIYVIIADYNNHMMLKRLAGNAGQCVISASDLSGLTAGEGMLQIAPWTYKTEDFSSKDYYFVIESVYTKMGITIN